jgi:hypothetical protein
LLAKFIVFFGFVSVNNKVAVWKKSAHIDKKKRNNELDIALANGYFAHFIFLE